METNNLREPSYITNLAAPWVWMTAIAFSLCSVAVLYWAFFGIVTETITGTGMLVEKEGVFAITAKSDGIIDFLDLSRGKRLSENDTVGYIYNNELFYRMRKLENEKKLLELRVLKIQSGRERLNEFVKSAKERRVSLLQDLEKRIQSNQDRLDELAKTQKALAEKGVISKSDYYKLLDLSLTNSNLAVNSRLSEITHDFDAHKELWENEEQNINLLAQIENCNQEIEYIKKVNAEMSWIRTEAACVILDVLKQPGEYVKEGEIIANVIPDGNTENSLKLYACIPARTGKKVKTGMSVFYSPSEYRSSEYGYLKGIVSHVSSYPISKESLRIRMNSEAFASLIDEYGIALEIEVDMIPDDASKNGYAWTSKSGFNADLDNGMFGDLLVNVEYRSPISYVLPFLREKFFE